MAALGIVFLAVGFVGDPASRGADVGFRVIAGLFGVFAVGFGAFVIGVRLPRRLLWSGEVYEVADRDGVLWTAYPRPLGTRIWDVLGPLVGLGFAFGAIAAGLLAGVGEGWVFVLVGLLFLTLMVPGLALGLRRALRERDSLRISASGIWMPAVGTIPWGDVKTIGVDDAALALSSLHPDDPAPVNQALRLAVRLRDGAVVEGRTGLDRYFLSIASLSPKPTSLGVYEAELSVPLETVLPTIERYRPAETSPAG